jgi:septation ring formation regulator EzrA
VNAQTRARMQNMVLEMLDEIAKLNEKFSLASEDVVVRRNILGHLTEIWTTLDELRPEKIEKGHGKISEPDKAILHSHLTKLLLLTNVGFTIFKEHIISK